MLKSITTYVYKNYHIDLYEFDERKILVKENIAKIIENGKSYDITAQEMCDRFLRG